MISSPIYDNIEALGLTLDRQSWPSTTSPNFAMVVAETKPTTIIEVGCWKGVGTCLLAELGRPYGAHVYAVDTWLGSIEHLLHANPDYNFPTKHGYPQLYFQFLHNVKALGFADCITPIPNTSLCASGWFKANKITAQLIYIDADHTCEGCYADLCSYWPLVTKGGIMWGDDYRMFPGVFAAVDHFAKERGLAVEERAPHWIIRKP